MYSPLQVSDRYKLGRYSWGSIPVCLPCSSTAPCDHLILPSVRDMTWDLINLSTSSLRVLFSLSICTLKAWISKLENDIIKSKRATYPTDSVHTFLSTVKSEHGFSLHCKREVKRGQNLLTRTVLSDIPMKMNISSSCVILYFQINHIVFNMSSNL